MQDAEKSTPPSAKQCFLMTLSTKCCPIHKYPEKTSPAHNGDINVIHRFKVVGEDECLLVLEQEEAFTIERFVNSLPDRFVVKSCSPLLPYKSVADYLKVDRPEGEPQTVTDGQFFWLQIDVGFLGKTVEELKAIWAKEALVAANAMLVSEVDVFKIAGERKVHVFIKAPAEYVDSLSFSLPLVQGLGNSITIKSKVINRF